MQINVNIAQNLTKDEKELFSIIKEVIGKYTPSTHAFAAGGWVRDKLIGIPSDDIDIMLSNISGEDFAKLLTKHLNIQDAHTIKSNPEKSKFITTAKGYIPLSSGKIQEVDFAQARSEVYKEDSRIPEIKPATPQEDAYRRDLTINSCFYNINENKLEDYTGMGIKDLVSNTFRTPEDPLKTFSDDPLRIFRTVRFTAKYNGNIDPQTYQAMTNPQLREEIKQKVSKERIGIEFIKMLKNPNPEVALKLLKDTGLWQDIISEAIKGSKYEGKMAELELSQQNAYHLLTVWGHTMQVVKNILNLYPEAEPEKRVTMLLAALMHDIGKLYQDIWGESKSHPGSRSYHGHEEESREISKLILQYLKIEPYIQQVSGLTGSHMRPHRFTEEDSSIKALRKFIRQMGEQSLNWIDVFNFAVADAYAKGLEIDPAIVEKYKILENRLQEALASMHPILTKSTVKPILDGNEIMQALNIKPGKWMATIVDFVKELTDENPNITKKEAIQKIKDKFSNITPQDIKKASKKSKMSDTCPQPILEKKIDEINQSIKDKKYYEALTIMDNLRKEFGNDEKVVRILSVGMFKLLIIDEKYRYNDLLQHILTKAEENFFDSKLCSYVLGILLLLETQTKDDVIRNMAQRTIKMSPETIKKVINLLPQNVFRKNLKQEIENMLGKQDFKPSR